MNYAESGSDGNDSEEDVFVPETKPRGRLLKRRKTREASEDNYSEAQSADEVDEGMAHIILISH